MKLSEIAELSAQQLERHADLEHEIWASWMRYMFSCGTMNPDRSWTMPPEKVERWQRQMNTPYSALSDREQKSDREQVLKHLRLDATGIIDRNEGTQS